SFLSDSTTRPSDLPLYVIVKSGNSHSASLKSCFKWPRSFWGDLGRNENRPRPLPLTPMLNPFFFHKTELSMHSLWLPGGLAPPCRDISNGRKSLYERHTAFDRGIFCQDGSCSVQQLDLLFDRNSFLVGVLMKIH